MAKQVIDFKEGERVNADLLVSSLTKGVTNSGAPYLSLSLQDSSKAIEAKLWDVKPTIEKELSVGKVFNFDLEINLYRGNLQAKVLRVLPISDREVNISDFVFKSTYSTAELRNNINEGIRQINNENLSKLVNALLNHYDKAIYEYPAAAKIHHNFIGGLATHVSGMLKVAMALCDIYPSIDKDLLLAGVIVHDLGKIEEFTSPFVTEYSLEGKLLGHISIMDARILEIAKELKLEEASETLLLRHMILSHHGQHEYGSPVLPAIMEAEMLNFIDNIDAKVNVIDKALADIKVGEFTQKLFSMENRAFYKHK